MRLLLLAVLTGLLVACTQSNPSIDDVRPNRCDRDNLICPDGSIVMRTGPSCAFVCPTDETPQAHCDYAAADRTYFSRYADMCAQLPTDCAKGETYFSDACGCGCTAHARDDPNGGIDPN